MKKQIIVGLVLFFTVNSFAQNKKILGDWKEVYLTQIDTSCAGKEELNSNPEAYNKGSKILSNEYISYQKILPDDEHGTLTIKITEDLDFFWLALDYKSDFIKKIIYAPKKNNYLITKGDFTPADLAIEYDEKTQHLLLVDEELGVTMYEFSRK